LKLNEKAIFVISSFHRRRIDFHQFLREIDEEKKYPEDPVYPV